MSEFWFNLLLSGWLFGMIFMAICLVVSYFYLSIKEYDIIKKFTIIVIFTGYITFYPLVIYLIYYHYNKLNN